MIPTSPKVFKCQCGYPRFVHLLEFERTTGELASMALGTGGGRVIKCGNCESVYQFNTETSMWVEVEE